MSNYNPQRDTAQFMTMCGQEVNTTPTIPPPNILLLRSKLLFEEVVKEFIVASGCFVGLDENGEFEVFYDGQDVDLVAMYDGLIDILYVTYGALNAIGASAELGFNEVHSSNMSKAQPDGTILKNEFGKVMKGSLYRKPDLKKVLEAQK